MAIKRVCHDAWHSVEVQVISESQLARSRQDQDSVVIHYNSAQKLPCFETIVAHHCLTRRDLLRLPLGRLHRCVSLQTK